MYLLESSVICGVMVMVMELNFFSQDTLSKDGSGQNSDLGSPELLTYP